MDSVIVFVAQYLLFIMAAGFAAFWVFWEARPGKIRLGCAAVVGLVGTLILMFIAGKVHSDPRPFVQNPALHSLIEHARDNGFPSDHSSAAGLIAALVLLRSRLWGALFAVAALLVAVSRVAAHLHHVQDVVAGLVFGAVAAVIAYYLVKAVLARLQGRTSLPLTGGAARTARHARIPER